MMQLGECNTKLHEVPGDAYEKGKQYRLESQRTSWHGGIGGGGWCQAPG